MNTEQNITPMLHPEDVALREELARLRASLTALLLQRDDLLLIQCRRIEAAYLRRYGALELKLYETWCACLRAKRKLQMLRALQNRRAQADPRQIEAELDGQLAQYRQELERRFQKVAGLLERRQGPGLSPKGTRELKELYRRAVKALHPDLHPGEDETRARALDQAMRAYRAGDLEELRAVCDSLEPDPGREPEGPETLRAERERLRRGLRTLDRELEEIKKSYPYNTREYLEDQQLGREKELELQRQLRELQTRTAQYEQTIARMLEDEAGEGRPE